MDPKKSIVENSPHGAGTIGPWRQGFGAIAPHSLFDQCDHRARRLCQLAGQLGAPRQELQQL